jgi:predicted branched-subunit amino acid permease
MDKWSMYLRGIGVGLIISWVTGAIAYFHAGPFPYEALILFELVLSAIFLLIAYYLDAERGKAGKRKR